MKYQKHRNIRGQLTKDLVRDEGYRRNAYHCPNGKLTIGVGRNIQTRGVTKDEAEYLLNNDVDWVFDRLDKSLPWWMGMPEGPKLAVANMLFNMGWPRFKKFKKTIAALKMGDYKTAAKEALDSKWARHDVSKARSNRIAKLIRSGK